MPTDSQQEELNHYLVEILGEVKTFSQYKNTLEIELQKVGQQIQLTREELIQLKAETKAILETEAKEIRLLKFTLNQLAVKVNILETDFNKIKNWVLTEKEAKGKRKDLTQATAYSVVGAWITQLIPIILALTFLGWQFWGGNIERSEEERKSPAIQKAQ